MAHKTVRQLQEEVESILNTMHNANVEYEDEEELVRDAKTTLRLLCESLESLATWVGEPQYLVPSEILEKATNIANGEPFSF